MAARRFPRREDAWAAPVPPAPPPAEPVESAVEDVAPVVAPEPPPAPPAPASGLVVVRVRGPGSVMCDGLHAPGDEFVTNLTEALSLGDAVEIIG
jgi:hypothetical protein